MSRLILASLVAIVAAHIFPATAQSAFRAPKIAAEEVVSLAAPLEKFTGPKVDALGRVRVGDVRELPKAVDIGAWVPTAGGFVARLRATSAGAEGLRVKLALDAVPGLFEVRVQGADPTQVETMEIDPTLGPEAWTPWTVGETQLIELYSRVLPSP